VFVKAILTSTPYCQNKNLQKFLHHGGVRLVCTITFYQEST
jgi:hypothetical protein